MSYDRNGFSVETNFYGLPYIYKWASPLLVSIKDVYLYRII